MNLSVGEVGGRCWWFRSLPLWRRAAGKRPFDAAAAPERARNCTNILSGRCGGGIAVRDGRSRRRCEWNWRMRAGDDFVDSGKGSEKTAKGQRIVPSLRDSLSLPAITRHRAGLSSAAPFGLGVPPGLDSGARASRWSGTTLFHFQNHYELSIDNTIPCTT